MKRTGLIIMFVVAILTACGTRYAPPVQIKSTEAKLDSGVYYNVTAADFSKMLGEKDFLLVNVHIPYAGEIPQTDLFVPYNEIEANLAEFPADKNAKVVVYCRSGSMSAIASAALVKQGYTNVWNVQGGMAAWEKEGNRLLQKQQ
ncbi:MAG: rhodanese-like domain-containing protein [Chloroflexi bacterium]|nr:rhodanese-like domain-containing protein [Chloroflexota bacterium]